MLSKETKEFFIKRKSILLRSKEISFMSYFLGAFAALSVCTYEITQKLLNEYSWNLILDSFPKIC